MLFHEPFAFFLLVLLCLLLCGDADIRTLIRSLWRPVPVELYRRGWCHLLGFVVGGLALIIEHGESTAAACLSSLCLVFLGGGRVFNPIWGVPAVVLYGLFPFGVGSLALFAILLWGAGHRGLSSSSRLAVLLVLLGLSHNFLMQHAMRGMAEAVGVTALCLLAGRWRDGGSLLHYCTMVRPILLLGIVAASRQEGLDAGADAALFAVLLDISSQMVRAIWAGGTVLGAVLPPLPGFVVAWVGMHAALGMTSSTGGWTIAGCVLAVVILALSLGEGLLLIYERLVPLEKGWLRNGALCALAVSMPPVCGVLMALFMGKGDLLPWWAWLYRLPGGDGAVLELPVFWCGLCILWCLFSFGWRQQDDEEGTEVNTLFMSQSQEGRAGEQLKALIYARTERYWPVEHIVTQVQQMLHGVYGAFEAFMGTLPLREPGAAFWLVFLGGVLVVLGVMQ